MVTYGNKNKFLNAVLLQMPLTNPYPGPQSVLILDNCNIHHAKEVQQLVEDDTGMMPFIDGFIFP
jgi:hypothetical protein